MNMYIKNTTESQVLRAGQIILAGAYHYIEELKIPRWSNSEQVLADLGSGDLLMATTDDGTTDMGVVDGINFLKGVQQKTQIQEEFFKDGDDPTGGRYQAMSVEFDITHAQDTWASTTVSFPYSTSLFSTEWINEALFEGDVVKVEVAPDTIVGAITADVAVDDTEISVSQTVVDNMRRGFLFNLFDGTNSEYLGRVLAVDKDALTVTVETAATQAFTAATPTKVRQTIQFIPHIMLKGLGRVELAKDVVGGSYVPPNAPIVVSYKNVEGTTAGKCFSFILEYKY